MSSGIPSDATRSTFQSWEVERAPEDFVGMKVTMAGKSGGLWERTAIVAFERGQFHLEGGFWIRNIVVDEPDLEPIGARYNRVYPFDIARGVIHTEEGKRDVSVGPAGL